MFGPNQIIKPFFIPVPEKTEEIVVRLKHLKIDSGFEELEIKGMANSWEKVDQLARYSYEFMLEMPSYDSLEGVMVIYEKFSFEGETYMVRTKPLVNITEAFRLYSPTVIMS